MDGLSRLRQLCELAPPGTGFTFRREELLALLDGTTKPTPPPAAEEPGDLTVDQLAARVQRAPSTVRGWLAAGKIPQAYHLQGRDWRVPPAALAEFLRQQAEEDPGHPRRRRERPTSLSDWRRLRRSTPGS